MKTKRLTRKQRKALLPSLTQYFIQQDNGQFTITEPYSFSSLERAKTYTEWLFNRIGGRVSLFKNYEPFFGGDPLVEFGQRHRGQVAAQGVKDQY